MPCETAALLLRQHEIAWSLASYHLNGLTAEECLWRPAEKGLHVTIAADGSWKGEWPEHEGYDLGPPSIAWLLWHMTFWWSTVIDQSFGEGAVDPQSITCPGSASAAAARLAGLQKEWQERVASLSDEELHGTTRAKWPFRHKPFADVVAWLNVELTKNAAELGYARFLYGTRSI